MPAPMCSAAPPSARASSTGAPRKTTGHTKPMAAWNVLLRDHHPGYISWEQYEANQKLISENAHMQRRTERKSARGGRALLTGLVRCGRCGRTMRVFYGTQSGHAHRYHCRGDDSHVGGWLCIGIGGVRIDRAVAAQIVEAVSEHAIEAAIQAADQSVRADNEIRDRRVRSDATARRDNQRRRGRDPARHLRRVGSQVDPRGRASRDAADAVGALADSRRWTRNRGRHDRRTRNRQPSTQVLQALPGG